LPCDVISKEVDSLLNFNVSHFRKSSKHKVALQTLQKKGSMIIKDDEKVKWLSKWQASTILCDNLKSVTTYYHDAPIEKDDGFTPLMYKKLNLFKLKYYR
jgi:hypothetical protein